jgi:putative transposase
METGPTPGKRFSPEQIINRLREVEVVLAQGKTTTEVCQTLNLNEQAYYR